MKKLVLVCSVMALLVASCGKNSSEYKTLQAERDSLALANTKATSELEEVLSLLNDVEDNFQSIKAAENYLSVQSSASGELTPSTREKIKSDMEFITQTLTKNKEQIANLEKKLKSSGIQSVQLQKSLESLRNQLSEKTMALVAMQDELASRDQKINELSESVTVLSSDVQTLRAQTNAQQETISKQQTELSTVYWCYGTSKELKKQNILVDGQLGSELNRDYFIKAKDASKLKEIELKAKKGQLVTKHPEGSYEFAKDANGQIVLKILDTKNFWSLSKYLVVLVNV